MRKEIEIFNDLEKLCTSAGFAHVVAYFCFRDNTISFSDKINTEDYLEMLSPERLLRTEISTLIGLMLKENINYSIQTPKVFQELIDNTEALLTELHHSLSAPMIEEIKFFSKDREKTKPLSSGLVLREPIFYSGESAFNFQYIEFSKKKIFKR